jgi:hypothetical protein
MTQVCRRYHLGTGRVLYETLVKSRKVLLQALIDVIPVPPQPMHLDTIKEGVHKLRQVGDLTIIDNLPRVDNCEIRIHLLQVIRENMHTVEIYSTTYLPRLVNVVCERPLIIQKNGEKPLRPENSIVSEFIATIRSDPENT